MGMGGFGAMRALSSGTTIPARASRPFDRDRDGFVLSEGAGLLVIEELEHAKARGAHIYGEMSATASVATAATSPRPTRTASARAYAMAQAIKDARHQPRRHRLHQRPRHQHAAGRQAETTAIKAVFQDYAKRVSISSTKSQLGHLLGASGGVEMILCLLALRDGADPADDQLDTPDPDCDLDYTPNQARQRQINVAMSNSFGFGGHNGSLVVGKLRNG